MAVFTIESLSFSYPERRERAVDEFSLRVESGEFLVVCGPSGCGKSTLLRQLKTALAPHGSRKGRVFFEGVDLDEVDERTQSERIGFVQQSPENQIVTDKVWHELAFGLESLGIDTPTIRRRVAEMASFFGIEGWFYKNVTDLSGGQKQMLNLASVMVMQPSVLILDEPTSQLDPIAAADFLATLGRINRELGTTIVLTEHRLEEAFPLATRVVVMDKGRLLCHGTPTEVGAKLKGMGHGMFLAMPTPMRVWAAVEDASDCPVTVRDGRSWLERFAQTNELQTLPDEPVYTYPELVIRAKDLWFAYEQGEPDVVKGMNLSVRRGEFVALLGGNGAGKTTTLKLLAGLHKPCRGSVEVEGSVGVLPQNPQTLFVKKTVKEDLYEMLRGGKLSRDEEDKNVGYVTRLCRLEELLERHPYDLSGGEQQRLALAKVLLLDPDILLMDEPTKGLDAEFKLVFAEILQVLLHRGVTILMVSHDIEFCARYAHRCALFFDGAIVTQSSPRAFFSGNSFYTTCANRMARSVVPTAVTAEDLIFACGGTLPPAAELPEDDFRPTRPEKTGEKAQRLPWWRKLLGGLFGLLSLALFLQVTAVVDFGQWVKWGPLNKALDNQMVVIVALLVSLFVLAFATAKKCRRADYAQLPPLSRRKLSMRTWTATALIILLIPLTLFVGETYLGGNKYYFISILILLETMIPFFLVFEGRRPQARELVIIAVLCAMAVAGRAVLFMVPQFKPVLALAIIAGVAFGGETGNLVGALYMQVSNMKYSRGAWTPWQMFAMGIIGFLAGVLFRKGVLRRTRLSLCIFGALASVLVYGVVMNTSSALLMGGQFNRGIWLSYLIAGFPIDCIQAAATWLFLWFAAEPMLEKLDRIKVKYGLVES